MNQAPVVILVRELQFLEAVKIQLEARDTSAIDTTLKKYGVLVPSAIDERNEQAFKMRPGSGRKNQIMVIDAAMIVFRSLIQQHETSENVKVE